MKRVLLALALLGTIGCEEQPRALRWRNVGPGGGGWIESLAMDPKDFNTIHVGCDVGGYYKSTDGGKTFTIWNEGLKDHFIERILVDPSDPQTIYLATPSGVHKSANGGHSWRLLRSGFPETKLHSFSAPIGALVMDPSDRRTLYAGIGQPRFQKGGCGHVYKTTDAGETWTLLDGIAKSSGDAIIHQLAIRPDDPKTLFAATDKGIFKSADAGATWALKEKGLPHRLCRNIAIHPKNPNILYAVLWSQPGKTPWQGGVYRSDDGGESWTARNDGLPQKVAPPGDAPQKTCNFIRLAVDPRDPERVFVGACSWWGAGLYGSRNGGKQWELVTRVANQGNADRGWITMWGLSVECIAVSPLRPDTMIFGTSGVLMRTDDAGGAWKQFYTNEVSPGCWQGNGVEVTCLEEIVVDPFDPKKIYCGYADIGIMVTEDGGATWSRRIQGLPSQGDMARVVCDPKRPGVAWCCEGKPSLGKGCIGLTTDGGRTWQPVGCEATGLPQAATRFLLLDPASPVDARVLYVYSQGRGVYKTTDGGKSWKAIPNGLPPEPIVGDLAMDAKDSKRLFAAVNGPQGGMFGSEDGGGAWRRLAEASAFCDIQQIAVDPNDSQVLFAACRERYDHATKKMFQGGVFKSADGGRTWHRVFEDRFASCVRISPFDSKVVYVGTTDHPYHDFATGNGIFVSRDGGRKWQAINAGLTVTQIGVITPDPTDPKRIYAGTGGNGLFIGTWE